MSSRRDTSVTNLTTRKSLALLASLLLASTADARTVSFYANPSVTSQQVLDAPIAQRLAAEGDTLTVFDDFSPPSLALTLAATDLLVLDQYTTGSLMAGMAFSAREDVRNYVAQGGGVLIAGTRSSQALSAINFFFGTAVKYALDPGSTSTTLEFTGAPFDVAPVSITTSADALTLKSTFSPSLISFYGDTDLSSVFGGFFGDGAFVYMGIPSQSAEAIEGPLADAIAASADFAVDARLIPLPSSSAAGILLLAGLATWRTVSSRRG
ncbi:MAG: hypothetical protein RIG82_04315 [Phycisphaeraceae bacterium]